MIEETFLMSSSSPYGLMNHLGKNRISLYLPATKFAVMDERLLDVIIGFAAFLILVVLLAVLPLAMAPMTGYAYIVAIIIFILFLSGAGYLVNGKIT